MKNKILLCTLLSGVVAFSAHAQSNQFRYRVKIKKSHIVYQKIKNGITDSIQVHKGDELTNEKKVTVGGEESVLKQTTIYDKDEKLTVTKDTSLRRYLSGFATVAFDKDDPSKININFWLNPKNTIDSGRNIVITKKGVTVSKKLAEDTTLRMSQIPPEKFNKQLKELADNATAITKQLAVVKSDPKNEAEQKKLSILYGTRKLLEQNPYGWIAYAPETWTVYGLKETTKIENYYAIKYQDDYFIQLKNREYVSFWYDALEAGALTIPFKYRFEGKRNGISYNADFQADANIGAYFGYTFGKVKYMYRKGEEKTPSKWQLSVGPFLSVSNVALDNTNTQTAGKDSLTKKLNVPALSVGFGLMADVYNFRVGLYGGWDKTFGDRGRRWDYNGKFWLGFGIGYNIALITGGAK